MFNTQGRYVIVTA